MAELFGVNVPAINKHLTNIFESEELSRSATISKMEIVQPEGGREVTREVELYNLDAIIAVGYRVNSYQATQFRIWATKTLREFIIKGFVLDDERLKQGKTVFGKDYFDELLERIREIRASERRFYLEARAARQDPEVGRDRGEELPERGARQGAESHRLGVPGPRREPRAAWHPDEDGRLDWASFLNSFLGLARSEKLAVGATVTACYLIANGSSGHAPMLSLAFRTFEFTRIARRTCFVP